VAVVTGAGAETGRAIALRLAAGGALVVVADIDLPAAEATVEAIVERGGTAAAIATDVTDDDDVARMIEFAGRDGGGWAGIQILVNNAGGWGEANYPEATPDQWSATLDLNLRSAMLATQLALEPMRKAGGGVVVNVASTAGIADDAYASPDYGAAKAGLIRFTTSLAELEGVRVNCIVPDWIATDRAQGELERMTAAERTAAGPLVPMADVAAAVIAFIGDDELAGRVVLLRGGRPRRFLS
jgi:NAD(P)-dependent dehydrogenase (short-subunit alcohol dehydrogenase family)